MNRRKRVFDLVVNPLICNNLTPLDEEVFAHKNANKIRYRYRGPSTLTYKRDPSYIHMNNADRFTLYYR